MENFNNIDKYRKTYETKVEITSCDFDIGQRIMAIGLKDGSVKVLNTENFAINGEFVYGDKAEEILPSANAVNCRIKGRIIVGYEDGKVKEFVAMNPSQVTTFIPTLKHGIEIHSPVLALECCPKEKYIIAAYNNTNDNDGRIFTYKSDSIIPLCSMPHLSGFLLSIQVLEHIKILVTLTIASNEITMYDYLQGEKLLNLQINIPNITDISPITAFTVLPVTKQIWKNYGEESEDISLDQPEIKPKEDIIAFGLSNETILTAYLSIKFEKGQISASVIPQEIYRAQIYNNTNSKKLGIKSLYIDPVTDNLLAGDMQGMIIMFNKAVIQVLNPTKAKKMDEKKAKSKGWLSKIGLGWGSSNELKESSVASNEVKKQSNPMELELEETNNS